MLKKTFLTILFSLFGFFLFSQNNDSLLFKPSGNVIVRTFFDFSQGFGKNSNKTGFNITRAFLGYSYQFTRTIDATVIIDGASCNENGNIEPTLRNAYLSWTPSNLDLNIGGSELYQFSDQEKYWRLRYLMPTFQALYNLGYPADWGITAKWKFNKFFAVDLSVTNGEGYKKLLQNASTRYAAGISIFPINNFILRAYADIYNQSESMRDNLPADVTGAVKLVNQNVFSLFAGYKNSFFSGGIEYAKLWNKGFIQGKNIYGASGFASVNFAKQFLAFARCDLVFSQNPSEFTTNWNTTDGQMFIAGVQFQPVKHLKIAPNFRFNNEKSVGKKNSYAFVSMEFSL